MINNGLLGRLYDLPVYEAPKHLTTRRVEKRIEPTKLEEQSSNVLLRLFNPPPMCRVEIREEQVAYLVNFRGMFGWNGGLFASKDSIASIMACTS